MGNDHFDFLWSDKSFGIKFTEDAELEMGASVAPLQHVIASAFCLGTVGLHLPISHVGKSTVARIFRFPSGKEYFPPARLDDQDRR